jgi:hypothetical protein
VAAPPSDAARRSHASIFPSASELLDLRGPFLVPLLTLVVARLLFWLWLPLASEDAYITFRYARSFAQGHGLAFNPGEHVMGFTSAPWTLWNAIPMRTAIAPELWSRATLLVLDVLTLLAGGRMLMAAFGAGAAWAFTFFFAGWPYFSAVVASGMENGAMLSLIVVGAALARAGSPVSGPVIGLLALWRPEGVVAALVILLGARWRDRLVALAIAGAAYAGLALSFGSPLAQSALAKAKLYGTPGPWEGRLWWEWLLPGPLGRWSQVAETSNLLGLLMVLSPAVALGLPALWRERTRPVALAVAAALAVWLVYAVTGAPWFFWYFAVPLAAFAMVAAAGLPRITRGRAIPVAAALYVVLSWSVARYLYVGRAQNEYYLFAAASEVLTRNARPGESVMLEPIGIIGWRAPLRVIDEVGLVSPDVLERRLQGAGWYTDVIARRNPEWVVVRRGVVTSGEAFAGAGRPFRDPAERDSVFARYALVQELDPRSDENALQVRRRIR